MAPKIAAGSSEFPWQAGRVIPEWLCERDEVCHVEHRAPVAGRTLPWPDWVPARVVTSVQAALGIERPWAHQIEAAAAVLSGRNVAIATPPATGKSLAYLLPVMCQAAEAATAAPTNQLAARLAAPTALYLAPTKALAHDQLEKCEAIRLPGWKPAALDGDSDASERRYAREFATFVLSNPDMLHRSVLPDHARWKRFLRNLRVVVVDELHRYRGSFGSHVAAVLRRLRRVCAALGAHPVFVCASATTSEVGTTTQALTGVAECVEITTASAPRPGLDLVLWQPSSPSDVADLVTRFAQAGQQTLAFVRSRKGAELLAARVRSELTDQLVVAYRAGYLPSERRALEAGLRSGEARVAVATNALELGIDIAGLDAVVLAGFPGTRAAMWQQVGRAGRRDDDAIAVLVANDDPLDAYLFAHPDALFAAVEPTVLHPGNPYVLGPHLAAAAQEIPLVPEDEAWFGPGFLPLVKSLVAQGLLRERPAGWFWTRAECAAAAIDLRSTSGRPVEIIEAGSGRVVGTVDAAAADSTVHEGAVYLHQGEQWLVGEYRPDENTALVSATRPDYYTQALSVSDITITSEFEGVPLGRGRVAWGEVLMSSQVIGYLRRDEVTGETWDQTELDLPVRHLRTIGVWWTLPQSEVACLGMSPLQLGAAAHAAEHAAIGLLPAFAPCDRFDIGGLSTAMHPDTGTLTVFVVDGFPGGAGFAAAGYRRALEWVAATLDRLRDCDCEAGCPRCVMSPKCGNGNSHLDKQGAAALLTMLVA